MTQFKDIQVGTKLIEKRIVLRVTNLIVFWEVKEQLNGMTKLKIVNRNSLLDQLFENTMELEEPYKSDHCVSIFKIKNE